MVVSFQVRILARLCQLQNKMEAVQEPTYRYLWIKFSYEAYESFSSDDLFCTVPAWNVLAKLEKDWMNG